MSFRYAMSSIGGLPTALTEEIDQVQDEIHETPPPSFVACGREVLQLRLQVGSASLVWNDPLRLAS